MLKYCQHVLKHKKIKLKKYDVQFSTSKHYRIKLKKNQFQKKIKRKRN